MSLHRPCSMLQKTNRASGLHRCPALNTNESYSLMPASKTTRFMPNGQLRQRFYHGQRSHPIYTVWKNMRARCRKGARARKWYYDKGIKVCDRWNNFQCFLEDLQTGWRPGLTLERINGNQNYQPGNVRWATWDEQRRNRSDNHFITVDGVTKVKTDWSRQLGSETVVKCRLRRGWSEEIAVKAPVGSFLKHHGLHRTL